MLAATLANSTLGRRLRAGLALIVGAVAGAGGFAALDQPAALDLEQVEPAITSPPAANASEPECDPMFVRWLLHIGDRAEIIAVRLESSPDDSTQVERMTAADIRALFGPDRLPSELRLCVLRWETQTQTQTQTQDQR